MGREMGEENVSQGNRVLSFFGLILIESIPQSLSALTKGFTNEAA